MLPKYPVGLCSTLIDIHYSKSVAGGELRESHAPQIIAPGLGGLRPLLAMLTLFKCHCADSRYHASKYFCILPYPLATAHIQ